MSAEPSVVLPERAGSRKEARTHLEKTLPADLTGLTVNVNGDGLAVSAPSYLDELVKVILEERHADRLVLRNCPRRAAGLVLASAQRRGLEDRLVVRGTK